MDDEVLHDGVLHTVIGRVVTDDTYDLHQLVFSHTYAVTRFTT